MKSFLTAFSMFSRIPTPQVLFEKSDMKYTLVFFPLVGAVIGCAVLAWYKIAEFTGVSGILFAAVAVAIPIAISGGIHMDGLIDVSDALAGGCDAEKRKEILKDPRVGAFGVIYCGVYFIVQFGLWYEIYIKNLFMTVAIAGFIVSRALAGIALCAFPISKNNGLAHIFSEGASKKTVTIWLSVYVIIICCVLLYLYGPRGLPAILLTPAYLVTFSQTAEKKFGGLSGDLAGYFIQLAELVFLAVAAFMR